jgi:hypothetical protein
MASCVSAKKHLYRGRNQIHNAFSISSKEDMGDRAEATGEQLSFAFVGEAAQQDAAHDEIEQYLAGLDEPLIVLGEQSVGGEPCQCSLDYRSYNGAKFPNAGEVPMGLSPQASEVALGR